MTRRRVTGWGSERGRADLGDQFFWDWRVQEFSTGPKPIPRKKFTAASLASAIQQAIQDGEIKNKAAQMGEKIRAEMG